MPKFSRGDLVRLIPNIPPPILGAQQDAVCSVIRSGVFFGRGPEGEIDVQLPDGRILMSLPAARFEEVTNGAAPLQPPELEAGKDGASADPPPLAGRRP